MVWAAWKHLQHYRNYAGQIGRHTWNITRVCYLFKHYEWAHWRKGTGRIYPLEWTSNYFHMLCEVAVLMMVMGWGKPDQLRRVSVTSVQTAFQSKPMKSGLLWRQIWSCSDEYQVFILAVGPSGGNVTCDCNIAYNEMFMIFHNLDFSITCVP